MNDDPHDDKKQCHRNNSDNITMRNSREFADTSRTFDMYGCWLIVHFLCRQCSNAVPSIRHKKRSDQIIRDMNRN